MDNTYKISSAGEEYNSLMKQLLTMADDAGLTLFTIEDKYQLYRIALESGGFRLSGILNSYAIAFHYEIDDGRRVAIPDLPPLFGSLNRSGIRDLTVTSDDMTDIAYTVDGYYNGIYYTFVNSGIDIATEETVTRDDALAKMVLPDASNINEAFVRVAGKIDQPVSIKVRGKTSGLWFSMEMTAKGFYPPPTLSYRPYEDPQWAFRTAEQLFFADYIGNAEAIKKIGKEFHIVTRQTSLLALEPGMELWEDSSWQQEEQTTVARTGSAETAILNDASSNFATEGGAPTSGTTSGSGLDLDGISLEDILNNRSSVITHDAGELQRKISVTARGVRLRVTLPVERPADPMRISIFDLKGRLVAFRTIMPYEFIGGYFDWNLKTAANRMSHGMYTVNIATGVRKNNFRITFAGK
ncbi:MAG: hypothetical protein JW863_18200 [Chitinispirillaceae bacterium]|nr:hypothetical protein [Chitinispirillaceae bacterium]